MARLLWSAGTILVALGIAAQLFGWDAIMWIPSAALDALLWIPQAVVEALREDPRTYGVILAGLALMLVARLLSRHG